MGALMNFKPGDLVRVVRRMPGCTCRGSSPVGIFFVLNKTVWASTPICAGCFCLHDPGAVWVHPRCEWINGGFLECQLEKIPPLESMLTEREKIERYATIDDLVCDPVFKVIP